MPIIISVVILPLLFQLISKTKKGQMAKYFQIRPLKERAAVFHVYTTFIISINDAE